MQHMLYKPVLVQRNVNTSTEIVFVDDYDDNIRLKTYPTAPHNKKILVMGLITNIQPHFKNLDHFYKQISSMFSVCNFFYLTNNNHDDTIPLLNKWKNDYPDKVDGLTIPDETLNVRTNSTIGNRVRKLAHYRNLLVKNAKKRFGTDFDYMLMMDTDIICEITKESFLSCFKLDQDFDIIAANGTFFNSSYHYDVFALRWLGQPNDITQIYPDFHKYYGMNTKWIKCLYNIHSWKKVKSAWGGMQLMNKNVLLYDGDLYDENAPLEQCEHVSLCNKFNNIFINPFLTFETSHNAEGCIYDKPYAFIPRDAGFFSVFNFFIGSLMSGARIYPLWVLDEFMNFNKNKPQHFCYFGNYQSKNVWFEYFQPLQFFKDDKTSFDIKLLQSYSKTQGETAPQEFRIPSFTNELLSHQNTTWRKKVHKVFKYHIKLNPSLSKTIDDTWFNLFKKNDQDIIGVHFRHPSHCCEQGHIFLVDYFQKIDHIISQNPDKNILIYLATDTDFGIYAFIDKYGSDRVRYDKNIKRTSMDNLLAWAFARGNAKTDNVGFINNKGYELQHETSASSIGGNIKMGIDVLVDVFCLCRCKWFIHTLSNLSLAVSYINPELDMIKV